VTGSGGLDADDGRGADDRRADTDGRGAMRSIFPRPEVTALYNLILTADERRAFDWVGDRYVAGAVADLLLGSIPEGQLDWEDDGDITFILPEHVAWQVRDLAEEEGSAWPCFAPDLAGKLNDLCWGVL
jgi:hypothetical protein